METERVMTVPPCPESALQPGRVGPPTLFLRTAPHRPGPDCPHRLDARQGLRLGRFRHGWGIVCGLDVRCDPTCEGGVVVEPGYAVSWLRRRHGRAGRVVFRPGALVSARARPVRGSLPNARAEAGSERQGGAPPSRRRSWRASTQRATRPRCRRSTSPSATASATTSHRKRSPARCAVRRGVRGQPHPRGVRAHSPARREQRGSAGRRC